MPNHVSSFCVGGSKIPLCAFRSIFTIDGIKAYEVEQTEKALTNAEVNVDAQMKEYLDKSGDAFCNDLDSDFSKLIESVNSLSELDHSAATWEQKSKELCKSMFIPFSPEIEVGQKFFESDELCEKLVKAFDEIWKK